MRLNFDDLTVQSFSTTTVPTESDVTSDTGQFGPHSYCWICEPTDPGVPSCNFEKCDA